MRPAAGEGGAAGFSLVEVLVAFLVMSIAVIYGMRLFGDGTRRLADAEQRLHVIAAAREALDMAGAGHRQDSVVGRVLPGEEADWSPLRPHILQVRAGGQTIDTVVLLPASP